ncbi:MAG: DJ-1/PfpI family protein [Spirochaetes bacterium]|nr:DJ-1/PfpI family protein [Spirochaetota bacterium]
MKHPITIGILLFHEVEVLDFAGPFEVFSITESLEDKSKLFKVYTISEKTGMIQARNGLKVLTDYTYDQCPELDVLIVPGGYGAEKIEVNNPITLNWLKIISTETKITASVCTGAFLLAKAGIITNHKVTTHWMDCDLLQEKYPDLKVVNNTKFVDQGKIITAAGISAGIEMSLHLVKKLCSKEVAQFTAKRMEYEWLDETE